MKSILTPVQVANLHMLVTVQSSIKEDQLAACCTFRLRSEDASELSKLTMTDMLSIVAYVGEQCLFPPRSDLVEMLALPRPLLAAMAMVRRPN